METVAQRFETTHRVLRDQLSTFTDRTATAGQTFARETREASGELGASLRGEARAWSELLSRRTTKLLRAPAAAAPTLSVPPIDGLERRLLVGLRDLLTRLDARIQHRIEDASLMMPIEGYDTLSAKAVVARLGDLDDTSRAAIAAYEAAHKSRKTILTALARRAA